MAERDNVRPRVLVITGPTATGKTALAIETAKRLGGEIICADSMQIYAILKIGTARPNDAELAAAPHRLYGFLDPAETYSVSDYIADAAREIQEVAALGKVPILCGGTGLYISSLLAGLQFDGEGPDTALRTALYAEYEQRGGEALIAEIAQSDPKCAASLHPNNAKRIVRALELLRSTGHCVTAQNERTRRGAVPYPHELFVLASADRSYLYDRIERRVDAMLAEGLVDEARYVYENRSRCRTAAQAIGYKEFFGLFEETQTLEECAGLLKQATRRYAKRQLTWWRREPQAHHLEIEGAALGQLAAEIERIWRRNSTEFTA